MLKKQLNIKFQHNKQKLAVHIVPPTYKVEQEMRIVYAKAYRQSIQQGVLTRPAMNELMRKEGIWGDEQEEELTNLSIQATLLEGLLLGQDDHKGQKKIVLELAGVRSKLYELVQIKTMPLEHTAEQIAEDVQMDFYVAACTYTENGLAYFKSHEDFLNRRHDVDADKIFTALAEELSKDNLHMIRKLPEHEWLISNEYMSQDGTILDKMVREDAASIELVVPEQKE